MRAGSPANERDSVRRRRSARAYWWPVCVVIGAQAGLWLVFIFSSARQPAKRPLRLAFTPRAAYWVGVTNLPLDSWPGRFSRDRIPGAAGDGLDAAAAVLPRPLPEPRYGCSSWVAPAAAQDLVDRPVAADLAVRSVSGNLVSGVPAAVPVGPMIWVSAGLKQAGFEFRPDSSVLTGRVGRVVLDVVLDGAGVPVQIVVVEGRPADARMVERLVARHGRGRQAGSGQLQAEWVGGAQK